MKSTLELMLRDSVDRIDFHMALVAVNRFDAEQYCSENFHSVCVLLKQFGSAQIQYLTPEGLVWYRSELPEVGQHLSLFEVLKHWENFPDTCFYRISADTPVKFNNGGLDH